MKKKISQEASEALRQLDIHLNPLWQLGRNALLAWTIYKGGIKVLVVPVQKLLGFVSEQPVLLHGTRFMEEKRFAAVADYTRVEPIEILTSLKIGATDAADVPWQTVEGLIRRYSISETPARAVMLFDIVGFSKATPIQQIGRLNALEYAINAAQRQMTVWGVPIEIARSTTGDGFYVWNRNLGLGADLALLVLLILVLAENNLDRSHDRFGLSPSLRATFAVGRHYSYHQIEGLSPRGYDYIVGDVTITLARLIDKTEAGQILIGDFTRPLRDNAPEMIATVEFVAQADRMLRKLVGRPWNGHAITEAQLSLTETGASGPARLTVTDKHGMEHFAYAAQARMLRAGSIPILLGASTAERKSDTETIY